MATNETKITPKNRKYGLAGLGVVLIFLLLLIATIILLNVRALRNQLLFPLRPSSTPLPLLFDGVPQLVNFDTLDRQAPDYQGRRIRLTGQYFPLTPPECTPYNGPIFTWSLVGDSLQVNAKGFESVVRLVVPNTTMTVEGIWRWYAGPVGCGKEPAGSKGVWYLEVEQILAPNPIGGSAAAGGTRLLDDVSTAVFPTAFSGTPAAAQTVPPSSSDGTVAPTNSTPGNTPLTQTATPGPGGDPLTTSTPTPTTFVVTATATGIITPGPGATLTQTPTPGTGAPTATVTPTTAGGGPVATLTFTPSPIPLITSTPGSGYPGPTSSPPPGYP
jgi:hypothetical protein